MTRSRGATLFLLAATGAGLLLPAQPARSASYRVPGTSDLWLAGMPDGSTASFGPKGGDTAPFQSPVLVTGFALNPGDALSFAVTGGVGNTESAGPFPIDGNSPHRHDTGAENGISDIWGSMNSLIGVFLDNNRPDTSPAPAALNFWPVGNVPGGFDYTTISPALRQVFFIGDGLAGGSVVQQVIVPQGATRLFLGSMDGYGWFNNSGEFMVTLTATAGQGGTTGTGNAPEPGTLALAALGALGLIGYGRYQRHARRAPQSGAP